MKTLVVGLFLVIAPKPTPVERMSPPIVVVPPAREQTVRADESMYIAGLVTVGVGLVATGVGLVESMSSCLFSCSSADNARTGAWAALTLTGIATMAVGIPLTWTGGRRVTRVVARVGPTGGSLHVTF